ncbi:hypothetical protein EBR96_05370 [bacterium]|nr:hypothetical protein [bacterium]
MSVWVKVQAGDRLDFQEAVDHLVRTLDDSIEKFDEKRDTIGLNADDHAPTAEDIGKLRAAAEVDVEALNFLSTYILDKMKESFEKIKALSADDARADAGSRDPLLTPAKVFAARRPGLGSQGTPDHDALARLDWESLPVQTRVLEEIADELRVLLNETLGGSDVVLSPSNVQGIRGGLASPFATAFRSPATIGGIVSKLESELARVGEGDRYEDVDTGTVRLQLTEKVVRTLITGVKKVVASSLGRIQSRGMVADTLVNAAEEYVGTVEDASRKEVAYSKQLAEAEVQNAALRAHVAELEERIVAERLTVDQARLETAAMERITMRRAAILSVGDDHLTAAFDEVLRRFQGSFTDLSKQASIFAPVDPSGELSDGQLEFGKQVLQQYLNLNTSKSPCPVGPRVLVRRIFFGNVAKISGAQRRGSDSGVAEMDSVQHATINRFLRSSVLPKKERDLIELLKKA